MPSSRVLRGEAGQSTALVLSMLFVMVLFVAVVVNVGQAVNRRIGLQIVADAGAFTGATEMAVGLNQIAYWNKWIQTVWAPLTLGTAGFYLPPFAPCWYTDGLVGAYSGARILLGTAIGIINLGYTFRPRTEAERVSRYNIEDLFPGEVDRFTFDEWDPSPEAGIITPQRTLLPVPTLGQGDFDNGLYNLKQVNNGTEPRPNFGLPSLADSRRRWSYLCLGPPRRIFGVRIPRLETRNYRFNVWYEKASQEANHFVWLVTVQPTRALMFDSILGPNAIPEMRAIGVAKPVGGHVGRGESRYVAKMVPAARAMALSWGSYGAISDSSYRGPIGPLRPVTH